MTVYNKLARDKVPEIIGQDGKALLSRMLDYNKYVEAQQGNE
ncbi:hypothetical protein [Alicyclobacillus sp. SO9]|nr:hypothetical protein [Alicyclobacillus sp. SO9]